MDLYSFPGFQMNKKMKLSFKNIKSPVEIKDLYYFYFYHPYFWRKYMRTKRENGK